MLKQLASQLRLQFLHRFIRSFMLVEFWLRNSQSIYLQRCIEQVSDKTIGFVVRGFIVACGKRHWTRNELRYYRLSLAKL